MINVVRKGQRERETREGERCIHRHTEMKMESQEKNDLQEKSQSKTHRRAATEMEKDQRKSQKETNI